jgi:cytochrome c556
MRANVAIVAAALTVALGAGAVIAQSSPIAARKALMKENNDHARELVQMIRGSSPFDGAKVEAAYKQWAETAQKLPGLFPPDSKTGDKTRATSKVWETKADFDAHSAAFGKAVADTRAQAVASLDGLKAGIAVVGKACDDCHKDYRARSQ